MNKNQPIIISIIGLIILFLILTSSPWGQQKSGITQWIYSQGVEQSENAANITQEVVEDVESKNDSNNMVGERKEDGSNWSIPSILRHWFKLD